MTPVEKIKEKLSIVDVVSNYVKLEKAGANLKGKCPFHNEKTPSFFVSPGRNTYYCFGCNVKGDIFSFVQEFEKVDFKGALKILAERAGVQLKDFNPKEIKEKDTLLEIMESASRFFEENLTKNKSALDYLKERGLKPETIKEWRIGFAFPDWNSLNDFLQSKGYKEKDLEKAGLIKKREEKEGFYDRFRGRIMFPIFDPSGRVVAFSGRIFEAAKGKEEAKYINSPETPLFIKSEILFGYHKAKNFIRQKKFALLVEGQFDLIMAHQAGLHQAIATSGTALTEGQLLILKRSSTNLMIAYDGDKAGINASKRAFASALALGFDVKVAPLPTGVDPADVIKKDPEEFKNILRHSLHIIDFSLQNVLKKGLEGRALLKDIRENVLPYVNAAASPVERAYFVSKIAEKINIPEDAIYEELSLLAEQASKTGDSAFTTFSSSSHLSAGKEALKPAEKKTEIERKMAGAILGSKETDRLVMEREFNRLFEDLPTLTLASIISLYEGEKDVLAFEAERDMAEETGNYFTDLALALKREIIKAELDVASSDLRRAEKEGNSEKASELLKVCRELTKRLSYLKM